MTTLGRTVSSCILSLAAIGTMAAQSPPAEVALSLDVPEGALLAAGPQPDLELLYTGDVIGYVEDCGCKVNPAGGLARRAWLVGQIKKNYPGTPLLLLDTGNFSDNPTETGDVRTAALLKEMVGLGYKVVGVGERDLTMGYDELAKRIEGLPLQFISTNIVTQGTKKPIFAPYAIVDVPGRDGKPIRVGVLSAVRYTPVWQKSGPAGTNLAAAPVVEMVKTFLPEIRAKSDVVVLMAALAKDDAHEVARQLPEIDMMIGSYGGIFSSVEEREGKVPVYYTGNQGKRIGESRISLASNRRPSEIRSYVHFLTAKYPSDKEMAERVASLSPSHAEKPNAPALLVPKAELTVKPPSPR
jgi:2',3'-cyclic-nucleotide 2'-phosphodiesterase (5'-nucleotidase family)